MEFMQNTIEKEERIKIAVLTEQNQKNRIANYQESIGNLPFRIRINLTTPHTPYNKD